MNETVLTHSKYWVCIVITIIGVLIAQMYTDAKYWQED